LKISPSVCSELSGGLDSSSIFCTAAALTSAASNAPPSLRALSYVTSPPSTDEPFIDAVEAFCGLPTARLPLEHDALIRENQAPTPAPAWWEPRHRQTRDFMDSVGAQTLVTGQMGDLVMGNWYDDSEQIAAEIARGRWVQAIRSSLDWARVLGTPVSALMAKSVRSAAGHWKPGDNQDLSPGEVSRDELLSPRLRAFAESPRLPEWLSSVDPGRRKHFWAVNKVLKSRALETPEALRPACWTHPFADRRMVEFMLSIPAGVVCGPGEPRKLMRRALAGHIPEVVRRRGSKTAYDPVMRSSLRPLARFMLSGRAPWQMVERGYIDRDQTQKQLQRFVHGAPASESALRQIILLEFWLRARENCSKTPRNLQHFPPLAALQP